MSKPSELFTLQDRVVTSPHTDAWIMGDKYGVVTKIGRIWVHVKMDRSGKVRKFRPDSIARLSA